MWATKADLLVCKHKEKLFFTPMANVKFGFFKEETMEIKIDKDYDYLAAQRVISPQVDQVPVKVCNMPNEMKEDIPFPAPSPVEANLFKPAKKRGRPFKNPQ